MLAWDFSLAHEAWLPSRAAVSYAPPPPSRAVLSLLCSLSSPGKSHKWISAKVYCPPPSPPLPLPSPPFPSLPLPSPPFPSLPFPFLAPPLTCYYSLRPFPLFQLGTGSSIAHGLLHCARPSSLRVSSCAACTSTHVVRLWIALPSHAVLL